MCGAIFLCLGVFWLSSESRGADTFSLVQKKGNFTLQDDKGIVKNPELNQKFAAVKRLSVDEGELRVVHPVWGTFMLFSGTEVFFEEKGSSLEISLGRGQMRFQKGSGTPLVKTPLTEVLECPSDIVIEFAPEKPEAILTVLEGAGQWLALGRDVISFHRGERSRFRGILEDGQISFDLLLKAKKVARGDYLPLQVLPDELVTQISLQMDVRLPVKKKVVKRVKKPGEICEAPFAKFNQCAWFCLNNPKKAKTCKTDLTQVQCVRRRCNANGVWSEETRVPASQKFYCDDPKVSLRACDY